MSVKNVTSLQEGQAVASGDYLLQRKLGRGGFGEVWLATNVQLQKPVALKFFFGSSMTKELDALVVEEGRKLAQLTQGFRQGVEHVLIVHRHVISDGECPAFLELEYMEGGSLWKKLKEHRILPEDEVLSLAIQVGLGLQCAHHHKIVHSDLKPDNILLDAQRRFYKLGDFGLARRFEDMAGVRAGSPPYMSPEQFDAPDTVNTPADIYALGIVMYECIEGHPPFPPPPQPTDTKRTWEYYREQHGQRQPQRPRNTQVSEQFKDIILSCLAKSPKDRPVLADLISRLKELGRGGVSFGGEGELPPLVQFEHGGKRMVRNTVLDLRFVSPGPHAPYCVPVRAVNNRDFLRFVRDPRQSRWSPQQVPIHAHDGGYLKSWFQGQPRKGEEEAMLASVPYQAALDFCRWCGGELPDANTVEKLLTADPESSIAAALRQRQEQLSLPYLLVWCRVEGLDSERDGTLFRFGFGTKLPVERAFQPFLLRVRRPRNYCFPFYTFFPVIPAEVAETVPPDSASATSARALPHFADPDVARDPDKTQKASHFFGTGDTSAVRGQDSTV